MYSKQTDVRTLTQSFKIINKKDDSAHLEKKDKTHKTDNGNGD